MWAQKELTRISVPRGTETRGLYATWGTNPLNPSLFGLIRQKGSKFQDHVVLNLVANPVDSIFVAKHRDIRKRFLGHADQNLVGVVVVDRISFVQFFLHAVEKLL